MPHILSGEGLASLATLTFLEVILSVDNIVFLAVAVDRLAPEDRPRGRWIGLSLAMVLRIFMLVGLVWVSTLDRRLFVVVGHAVTLKDIVLIGGGLFLLAKGTGEIHETLASAEDSLGALEPSGVAPAGLVAVVLQIGLGNIVFSLDSVVTAVGMTSNLPIMIVAVAGSTLVMIFAARLVGDFINRRPTMKILALSFILLIGVALIADGLGFHIPRAYVYFAIAFSLFVEGLNSLRRERRPERRR